MCGLSALDLFNLIGQDTTTYRPLTSREVSERNYRAEIALREQEEQERKERLQAIYNASLARIVVDTTDDYAVMRALHTSDWSPHLLNPAYIPAIDALRSRVHHLSLCNGHLTKESCKRLAALFPNLQSLDLTHTTIDIACVRELHPLQNLKVLDIRGTKASTEAAREFCRAHFDTLVYWTHQGRNYHHKLLWEYQSLWPHQP